MNPYRDDSADPVLPQILVAAIVLLQQADSIDCQPGVGSARDDEIDDSVTLQSQPAASA